jgi:uncharacterized protein (UPF0147 family)
LKELSDISKEKRKRIVSTIKEEQIRDLVSIDLRKATDQELERLKKLTDDELLRASSTIELFALAESMRRLKNALHSEEKAIKWLTFVLAVLTILLVFMGVIGAISDLFLSIG